MNVVIFYTVYIFQSAMPKDSGDDANLVDENAATIIVGVVQFLATFGIANLKIIFTNFVNYLSLIVSVDFLG